MHHKTFSRPYLENTKWRLTFDKFTGEIVSLFDKSADIEVLAEKANIATVLEDQSDTWAHEVDSFNRVCGTFSQAEISVIETGSVRNSLRVRRVYGSSILEQRVSLYDGLDVVEIVNDLDWHEKDKVLKLGFELNLISPSVYAETPYGYVARKPKGEEEPCGRWIDASGTLRARDGKLIPYGLSIINDHK